jgi:hypothetical protein
MVVGCFRAYHRKFFQFANGVVVSPEAFCRAQVRFLVHDSGIRGVLAGGKDDDVAKAWLFSRACCLEHLLGYYLNILQKRRTFFASAKY